MSSAPRGHITPARFRWFALTEFVSMIVIVLTGAAVRLTGSGLGCPDWPTCHRHQLIGKLSYNSAIEYGNRAVTAVLIVVALATVAAALLRTPRRGDLVMLSATLVVGVLGEAGLGALVVYFKLNPWLVATHLVLSLAMVALSATLYHRSKYLYGPTATAVVRDDHFRHVARVLWLPLTAVIVAGTVATGSGPHAGGSSGQLVARRLPLTFSSAVWIHSVAAITLVALSVGLLLGIWRTSAPAALQLGVRRLCLILVLQATVGFAQYWTHVPALLVELHVFGAVSVVIAVTQFNLRQVARAREPGTAEPA